MSEIASFVNSTTRCLTKDEYSSSAAELMMADAACYTGMDISSSSFPRKKKNKNKNKRRFSDEQIRSLETMFESETKLEPRKKLQVARELGLQPRQVAIWFQNKRARWKSKQLERDYNILRANYNSLASQFDTLKKEKQSLVIQLQRLHDRMNSGEERQFCRQELARNGTNNKSENGDDDDNNNNYNYCELEAKPSLSLDGSEHGVGVLSDDDSSIKAEHFGLDQESELLNMVKVEHADGCCSMTSTEDWGSLESNGLLDQSTGSYQWWDFWS